MKRKGILSVAMLAALLFAGCGDGNGAVSAPADTVEAEPETAGTQTREPALAEPVESEQESEGGNRAALLYQGHASIRIVTAEGKVIYIDPYAGDGYGLPADLILVTHQHSDHNNVEMVQDRNEGCEVITQSDAIQGGEHRTFDFGYVTVEAVEAGYNKFHDVGGCVGYILTFSDKKSVYVTGDTSTTEQMPSLAAKNIDYAFFCCDGVYNMGLDEAAECAKMVGAKHNIPYHMTTAGGAGFDRGIAEQFKAPNCLIVEAGEEIVIE